MVFSLNDIPGPHGGQPVLTTGGPASIAQTGMLLVHGRGASAEDILHLVADLNVPNMLAAAPQATGFSWYPYRFLEPVAHNQPYLDSALAALDSLVKQFAALGIPSEHLFLLGFSQGACLVLEYAARHARQYAGIIGLSGGLIGAPGELPNYQGTLEDTPAFLGCSDIDPHIPLWRVQETAQVFQNLGAKTTTRIYPGLGHTVNQDELNHIQRMLTAIALN
jgi:predicted esterase